MFEEVPSESGLSSTLKILGGIGAGLIVGLLVPVFVFLSVSVTMHASGRGTIALLEVLDLAILAFVGYLAYQSLPHSPFARGLLIGVSLAFLLNAICGVMALGR